MDLDIVVLTPETAPAAPEARLTPAEAALVAGFPSPKRRADWILGRAAAKEAVRRALAATGAQVPDWTAFAIERAPSGAPRVALSGRGPLAVSLTHGHGHAAAWVLPPGPSGGLPGVDLEQVRARPEGTLRFYLDPEERAPVLDLPGPPEGTPRERPATPRDDLAVLLWALKEAAFKTLQPPRGLGLLDVHVTAPPDWQAAEGEARVGFRGGLAERADALGVRGVRAGWRRLGGDLVLAWVEARAARLPD